MKQFLFLVLLLVSGLSLAQRPTDIWYFGQKAGLDFRNGKPYVLHDGALDTVEGCTVISDDDGELLFYTDGVRVLNKEHKLMDNGSGLHGHFSSSQSAMIVPVPGNSHLYYIFTVDTPNAVNAEFYPAPNPEPDYYGWPDAKISVDDGLNNGLNYSVVDMSANGGLGKVISKNKHLVTYDPANEEEIKYKASEKLTALYHESEDFYWVLTHFIDTFYAFKVDSEGISHVPVTSKLNFSQPTSGYEINALGVLKFSPLGTKLAMANYSHNTKYEVAMGNAYLLDFDPDTGAVSNPLQIVEEHNPYGIEFSPDGSKLYISVQESDSFTSHFLQFDLNAANVAASARKTFKIGMAGAFQLASDGKIYIAMPDMSTLSRINNPNSSFDELDVEWYAIQSLDYLGFLGRQSRYGLPSFIQSYFQQGITFEQLCLGTETNFNLINYTNVASVKWNFGDPGSGTSNSSTALYPQHTYSRPGEYEVSAVVKSTTGIERTVTRKLEIFPLPKAFPVQDLYGCEDPDDGYTGYSSTIPTGHIEAEVLGGQENMLVTYYDRYGGAMPVPLDDPMRNMISNEDFITVRVAHLNNPDCYAETTVKIFVEDGAKAFPVEDIAACDNNGDGYAAFDLSEVVATVTGDQSNTSVLLFDEGGNPVVPDDQGIFINTVANRQRIQARIFASGAGCYNETEFDLYIATRPGANSPAPVFGCDDDGDGISEYFDVSGVAAEVLQGQDGLEVNYFGSDGNEIPNFTSPYTNLQPYEETITVRLTDPQSGCFTETPLKLKTSAAPRLNIPVTRYACDEGNGTGSFNTAGWTQDIIGNQTGLKIRWYDGHGKALPTPLPAVYRNSLAHAEVLTVKVEDEQNSLCASETTLELVVNQKSEVNLQESYSICGLEPFLALEPAGTFDSWEWRYQDGSIISTASQVALHEEGNYSLTVGMLENGVLCEETRSFTLVRSVLPTIKAVNFRDWSSQNYIEIIAEGDGDFEYSIDDVHYRDNNYFEDLPGGIYTVHVRDKNGCGMASAEVVLLDYPKFFTPNGDGYNDRWQLKGTNALPETPISIFDRYGKLLKQMSSRDSGWDGTSNGREMPADDYWFSTVLDGRTFKAHFTLRR